MSLAPKEAGASSLLRIGAVAADGIDRNEFAGDYRTKTGPTFDIGAGSSSGRDSEPGSLCLATPLPSRLM